MKTINQKFAALFFITLIAFMSSCSSDDDSSSTTTLPPPPDPDTGLVGNYFGTWNSTTPTATFTDFAITVKINNETLNGTQTVLAGEFYATSSYTSCCGNTNDGTMTIKIEEDDTISSFSFNDQIVGCTGNFSGSGEVNSNGDLIIDFTGNDCDGDHVGQIVLRK